MIKPLWSAKRAFVLTWEFKDSAVKLGFGMAVLLAAIYTYEDYTGATGTNIGKMIGEFIIAFFWHRIVLLRKENISWLGIDKSVPKAEMKNVNGGMKSFMWTSVGFALFYIIIAVAIMIFAVDTNHPEWLLYYMAQLAVATITLAPFLFRLALIFPAIAIGHQAANFKDAWNASEGQTLLILVSYFPVIFIWVIAFGFSIYFIMPAEPTKIAMAHLVVLNFVFASINVYFIMVWAGLNSTLFMQLHDDIQDYYLLSDDDILKQRASVWSEDSQ